MVDDVTWYFTGCFVALLSGVLLAIGISDWKYRIIPNRFIALLLILRLAAGFAVMEGWLEEATFSFAAVGSQLVMSIGVCGALTVLNVCLLRWGHRDGIGFGDIKLIFAMGLLMPPEHMLVFLLISSCYGVLHAFIAFIHTRDSCFPFGPSLIAGFCSCMLL